jgi:hypothetical protein
MGRSSALPQDGRRLQTAVAAPSGMSLQTWAHGLDRLVPIPKSLLGPLGWWTHIANLSRGVGAHLLHHRLQGKWTPAQACRHINVLELWAVFIMFIALQRLLPVVCDKFILIRTHNVAVLCYLNKQGGTKRPSLCRELVALLEWCEKSGISLKGEYVPGKGKSNRRCPLMLGRPHVDLCTNGQNHQLPTFLSWGGTIWLWTRTCSLRIGREWQPMPSRT